MDYKELFNLAQPNIEKQLLKQGRKYSGMTYTRFDEKEQFVLVEAKIVNNGCVSSTTMKFTVQELLSAIPMRVLKELEYWQEIADIGNIKESK